MEKNNFAAVTHLRAIQRWKYLSAANKLCDRFSCLYNLRSHTVSELKIKFDDTDSVGRMK